MRLQSFIGLTVVLGLGCVTVLTWRQLHARVAIIDYRELIELGPRHNGDAVEQAVVLSNRGDKDLVIDDIRTNCSCAGLEVKRDGKFARISILRIKPRGKVEVWLRLSVRGVPIGDEMVTTIDFRSNDPKQPNPRIRAVVSHVSGGVQPYPNRVTFGTLVLGQSARQFVDIWDDALEPRSIAKIVSTKPERIAVQQVPLDDGPIGNDRRQPGKRIGRFEIVANTRAAGEFEEAIEILADGVLGHPAFVTVSGRVAAPVEVAPAIVVLPRESATGPVYTSVSVARSTAEMQLDLHVESTPPGIRVEVLAGANPSQKKIHVVLDPKASKAALDGNAKIRFRARTDQFDGTVELPVILSR